MVDLEEDFCQLFGGESPPILDECAILPIWKEMSIIFFARREFCR